jgi:hypothetical protein
LNVFFLNTFISLPTFTFLLLIVRLKGTAGFYTSSSINDNAARGTADSTHTATQKAEQDSYHISSASARGTLVATQEAETNLSEDRKISENSSK